MLRIISATLGILTCCVLISGLQGVPLHGSNVRITRQNEYPFVVSIIRTGPNNGVMHWCTATFVSRRSVLTAAHCVANRQISEIRVIAIIGNGFEKFKPESWTSYEQWTKKTAPIECSYDDIAIITIKGEVKNPKIIPATMILDEPHNFYHSQLKIVSAGSTGDGENPLNVKTGMLTVITRQQCVAKGIKLTGNKLYTVPANLFCTEADPDVVTDFGDSGSPILNHENHVIGIHSGVCPSLNGHPEEFRNENQMKNHLPLYRYYDFISQHVK